MFDTRNKISGDLKSYLDNLVSNLASKDKRVNLSRRTTKQRNSFAERSGDERKHNDLKQYGRRNCLRFNGFSHC